jgi:hypothetical protein
MAGRTTQINSSLSSATIYQMSMYLLPKTITEILDKQRRMFFWQGGSTKIKYRLLRWEIICESMKKRRFGYQKHKKNELKSPV